MKCYLHNSIPCECDNLRKNFRHYRGKIKNDHIVVVDVESTCWDTRNGEHPPHDEKSEIIEVGVCLLNVKTGMRSQKKSIVIKPLVSKVSKFCTVLTGHTQTMVDQGVSFAEACLCLIEEYGAQNRVWASYGDYDRKMFQMQCGRTNGPIYPFSDRHINVKTIAALRQKRSKETGMKRCLTEWYNLPMTGRHHNGADDAWNIAAILGTAMGFNKNNGTTIHSYRKESIDAIESILGV